MSMNIDIYNIKGEKVGDYTLDDSCLEFDKGAQAVHDAVVGFLAEVRAGTASTKTRAEVSGSGKKPFKQKGLGRARAGSTRNPVWRHGGVAFGPKPRSFAIKLNNKVKQLALKRSFSERVKENAVIVLDQFDLADHKTKSAVAVLKALKADQSKLLISVKDYDDNVLRATGNLPAVILIKAASVNTYQILYSDKLLFTKDALDEFVKRLA
jgi:large subunit ribosomal protein L4